MRAEFDAVRTAVAEPLRTRALVRPALRRCGALAAGFAGGWAVLYGEIMPLGLGLTLGLAEDQFAAAAAGAALAMLARGRGVHGVCLLCALGAAAAARWAWPRRFAAAVLAGCGTLGAAALCFAPAEGVQLALNCGADALGAAALSWGLRRSPPEKLGAGALLFGATLAAGLAGVRFGAFVPAVAVCALVQLALCCRGQGTEALTACALWGAGLCAADESLALSAAGLACGTAAAALWAPGQRGEAIAAYAGGCTVCALCMRPPGQAFGFLAACGAALGIAALAPGAWLDPRAQEPPPAAPAERPRLCAAATQLEAAAQSLVGVAQTVNDVYAGLPRRCESFRWVIDRAHDTLCAHCGRCAACWNDEYAATMEGMQALRTALERQGHVGPIDLPGQLSRCIHPAALCAEMGRGFALYRSRQAARVHAEAMRTALTEQYGALAEALGALGEQLGRPGSPEPYRSERVAAFFASLGAPPLECAVTLDDVGRTRAAVTLPRTRFAPAELEALAQEVGRICRRPLEAPQTFSCKGVTTLLFCETPCLRAVFGAAGAPARGEVSGDAVQQFCLPGAAQMILCDGMGTGRPAAVDGSLAAELTARLLKAGFAAELAARLVNVALALKGEDEGGATLDLVRVDLYTGTARLFKAGAAPSFLVHGARVRTVGGPSLPVGVLGGVNGTGSVVHLAAGDYAVLVSDGLLADGTGWVEQQLALSAAAGQEPQALAQTLVTAARRRAESAGRPDDITAAVLRLESC